MSAAEEPIDGEARRRAARYSVPEVPPSTLYPAGLALRPPGQGTAAERWAELGRRITYAPPPLVCPKCDGTGWRPGPVDHLGNRTVEPCCPHPRGILP